MNIFSVYFILIQLCGIFRGEQIASLNFKCFYLKMTQFQTSYFSESVESYLLS